MLFIFSFFNLTNISLDSNKSILMQWNLSSPSVYRFGTSLLSGGLTRKQGKGAIAVTVGIARILLPPDIVAAVMKSLLNMMVIRCMYKSPSAFMDLLLCFCLVRLNRCLFRGFVQSSSCLIF